MHGLRGSGAATIASIVAFLGLPQAVMAESANGNGKTFPSVLFNL